MLRSSTSVAVISLVVLLTPLTATGDDQTLTDGDVRAYIDQLDANTLAERAHAERRLQDLGPAVLPHLPNPQGLSPGAADALQRIRRLLEDQQARQALRPGRVTLSGTRPLAEVLFEVASQTGNPIDVSRLPPLVRQRKTGVDFNQTLFWQAVSDLEEHAQIRILPFDEPGLLQARIPAADQPLPSASYVAGPFRIEGLRATVRPDFSDSQHRLLRLTIEVTAEPRLRSLFVHVAAEDLAVSDRPHALAGQTPELFPPLSPQASQEFPADKPGPVRFSHDVILPNPDASPLPTSVNVSGTIEIEVAAAEQLFTFRHLGEPGPMMRRHGGVNVTLDELEHNGSDLSATIQIVYDSGSPHFESHRAWVFHNNVALSLGEERRRPADFDTLSEGEGGVKFRYRFADVASLPGDAELQYTAPALLTRVPLEFAITGVTVEE